MRVEGHVEPPRFMEAAGSVGATTTVLPVSLPYARKGDCVMVVRSGELMLVRAARPFAGLTELEVVRGIGSGHPPRSWWQRLLRRPVPPRRGVPIRGGDELVIVGRVDPGRP